MLHQASYLYNQPIATKLDNDLSIWKSTNPNTTLPEEWQIEGLLDKFSDYKADPKKPASEAGGSNMTINALLTKSHRERNLYNNNKKKFEMRPIQCDCCQCSGHQIGNQVCQIGAQVYHIQSYKEKHPQEYKKNATRYETMNRPKIISKLCANNQLISSIEDFQDESEECYLPLMKDYGNKE